ncbi:MAG: 16S rRNA (adenine(1518)-N(6)/adenine(1519)-N(6))-dimethyltransferase RsmA [Promethearchaeota archaeon]
MPILSQKSLQRLFTQNKFKPSPDVGQTFIISERLVNVVTKALELKSEEDIILDVGPGFGAFTDRLLSNSKTLFLVEQDPICISYLQEYLSKKAPVFTHSLRNIAFLGEIPNKSRVNLIEGNILELPFPKVTKLVSNLPFQITYPFIIKLIHEPPLQNYVLILQKETVDHLLAQPGESNYTILSVFCNIYFSLDILETVPPRSYYPPPDVKTQVIRLTPTPRFKLNTLFYSHRKEFIRFTEMLFKDKRKTLKNWISAHFKNSMGDNGDISEFSNLKSAVESMDMLKKSISQIPVLDLFDLMLRSLVESSKP